ncbi:MAG: S1C family serine protease [Verrucomicrobiota bacterium]
MRLCIVLGLLIGLIGQLAAEMATIELRQGGKLRGEILRDRPEAVIVDLGFEVFTVPREAILSISMSETTEIEMPVSTGLYALGDESEELPVKELVERQGEAVVLIETPSGLGSGFIVHPDGYVVTNDHVIAGEHKIGVTVFEQGEMDLVRKPYDQVRIVASNPEMDLALLKIEGADRSFPTVPIGNASELRPGQPLFAIGSPLGLDRTVSQGIVSIRNRLIDGKIYIQTTAQISPGNSGGPLFNLRGEVIGVNNMKVVGMGAEGLSFSIPSTVLRMFLDNRDAFAFDPRNPNAGYRYNSPPSPQPEAAE